MTFAFSKISSWPMPVDIGDHRLPFYISDGKWPMLLYIHDLCLPCYISDGKWPMLLCFGNHCVPFYNSDGNNLSRIEKTNYDYQLTNGKHCWSFATVIDFILHCFLQWRTTLDFPNYDWWKIWWNSWNSISDFESNGKYGLSFASTIKYGHYEILRMHEHNIHNAIIMT